MKKHNRMDKHTLLMGIFIPILMFFISMSATYAYFTAKASDIQTSSLTAIIKVNFSETTKKLNSTVISDTAEILPGDKLVVNTKVENSGTAPIYAVVSFKLQVTKADGTNETPINKFYTLSASTLKEITGTDDNYSNHAFELAAKAKTSAFDVTYKFEGAQYDNTYKNATAHYEIKVNAIQTTNIGGNVKATNYLMDNASYKNIQLLGNTTVNGLPTTYQQVEYLESTGTQWIDTEYYPSNNTRILVDYQFVNANPQSRILSAKTDEYYFDMYITGRGYIGFNAGTSNTNTASSIKADTGRYIYEIDRIVAKIDGVEICSINQTIGISSYSLIFFARRLNDVIYYSDYPTYAKMYNSKIYDNGVLVRDFVPCYRKSDNVAGLYDKVHNKFYTNKGTGNFTVGAKQSSTQIESVGVKTINMVDYSTVSDNYHSPVSNIFYDKEYIDVKTKETYTYNLLKIPTLKANTTYTLWIEAEVYDRNEGTGDTVVYAKFGAFDASIYRNATKNNQIVSGAITVTPTEDTKTGINFNSNYGSTVAGRVKWRIMVVEGSYTVNTIPKFEPYGYKIPVTVSDNNQKNLAKTTNNVLGSLLVANGGISNLNYVTTTDYIPLKAGTYTISYKTGANLRNIAWFDNNKQIVSYVWSNRKNPFTFTINQDYYIRFDIERDGNVAIENLNTFMSDYNVQLEEGTTATEYTPHKETITHNIYLDAPLMRIGDVADYIDFTTGQVVRNINTINIPLAELLASTDSRFNIRSKIQDYDSHLPLLDGDYLNATNALDTLNCYKKAYAQDDCLHWIISRSYSQLIAPTGQTIGEYFASIASSCPNGWSFHYVMETPTTETILLPDISGFDSISIQINTSVQPDIIIDD